MSILDENGRGFASFSGVCPYACLHCYTFIPDYKSQGEGSIPDIVDRLKGTDPNIIYISGHKENFIVPDKGIELGEKLFDRYHCDIMMTTRNVFDAAAIKRLSRLNKKMLEEGKILFFCVSIPAFDSYKKLESNPMIPTPEARMNFLSSVYAEGISTFLTVKPLCPNEFIPIDEALEIIRRCKDFSTVVLSSGIVVDDNILRKLPGFPVNRLDSSKREPLMPCLGNELIQVCYVDVSSELQKIEELCNANWLPFFQHSMPAVKYVRSLKR